MKRVGREVSALAFPRAAGCRREPGWEGGGWLGGPLKDFFLGSGREALLKHQDPMPDDKKRVDQSRLPAGQGWLEVGLWRA